MLSTVVQHHLNSLSLFDPIALLHPFMLHRTLIVLLLHVHTFAPHHHHCASSIILLHLIPATHGNLYPTFHREILHVCVLLLLLPVSSAAAGATGRSLKHGDGQNMLIGKLQQAVNGKIHSLADKLHKGHKAYATQTVLAAQPTIVMAPMPQLAPQLMAPVAQEPVAQPAPPPPTATKTKSLTIAGHHKSITVTKSTEVPVSV